MQYSSRQSGFTLIEMLVSLSLFTIVMTITLGTLLILIKGNQVSVAEQSVMDTLAFSLDSMTREIRTGSFYVCAIASNVNSSVSPTGFIPAVASNRRIFSENDTLGGPFFYHNTHHELLGLTSRDCADGNLNPSINPIHGISFIEGGNSITGTTASRIMYYFDGSIGQNTIKRRVGTGRSEAIISESIEIVSAEFFVTGSARLRYADPLLVGDAVQPSVTIVIQARERGNDAAEIVTLQTTITQQSLDL